MAKFQEVQCPFCGRMVRNTDKFCIFCGSKLAKKEETAKYTQEEREEIDKELTINNTEQKSDSKLSKSKKKDEGTEPKKSDKKGDASSSANDLPESIVEQLEAKMDLAIVEKKKSRLKEKLQTLKEDLDTNRYENDIDYSNKITAKFEAFKTVKQELLDKEEEIRNVLGPKGQFRMDELEDNMEVQREQLIELKRQYKRRKIKKEIYDQLKLEYSTEFRKFEEELQELRNSVIIWLSKETSEKKRLENRIKMTHARYKSREIDEEEYTQQKSKLEKEIDAITERVNILDNYSKPRKSRWI